MTAPRHVGIVACSAEGAALCYRTFCTEAPALLGAAHAHPEVSLHGLSLAEQMDRIYADDWAGLGEMMLISARKLAAIGAQVLICPDNTIHQALALVRDRSPLPWLHIAEVVAAEARGRSPRVSSRRRSRADTARPSSAAMASSTAQNSGSSATEVGWPLRDRDRFTRLMSPPSMTAPAKGADR